jgi:RNA polymerase sigma-70 factor (ECF subfamily)
MMERQKNTVTRDFFGEAYEQGSTRTISFLMSKGFPEDEAREAAQAAWVRGWERRHQIRKPEKALSWVNAIALNLGRNHIRKQSRMQVFEEEPTVTPDPTAAADVEKLLGECRKKDRHLLTKRYLLGWGIGELATESECTTRAIRVRLHRARKSLRERFSERPSANHSGLPETKAA